MKNRYEVYQENRKDGSSVFLKDFSELPDAISYLNEKEREYMYTFSSTIFKIKQVN